jgi:hypothetical protein
MHLDTKVLPAPKSPLRFRIYGGEILVILDAIKSLVSVFE